MGWCVILSVHVYPHPIRYWVWVGRCPLFLICLTSPYLVKLSIIVRSDISGGTLAIWIFRIPIPSRSVFTCDSSPLSCLNSYCPFVSRSTGCICTLLASLMQTRRLGLSIWVIRMLSSARRNVSWIHSCIRNAVILGTWGSKHHTVVLRLSLILSSVSPLIASLFPVRNETQHYMLCRSSLLCLLHTSTVFRYSAQTISIPRPSNP